MAKPWVAGAREVDARGVKPCKSGNKSSMLVPALTDTSASSDKSKSKVAFLFHAIHLDSNSGTLTEDRKRGPAHATRLDCHPSSGIDGPP